MVPFASQSQPVVTAAQEEARALGHGHIGTEHLLLAVLADAGSLPARALASFGLSHQVARAAVLEAVPRGTLELEGPIPFTPRSKNTLDRGLDEAMKLGSSRVAPEHVLLALTTDPESIAAQILSAHGIGYAELTGRLAEVPPGGGAPAE